MGGNVGVSEQILNGADALCPNCHYIAHFLLRKLPRYKIHTVLASELKGLKVKA